MLIKYLYDKVQLIVYVYSLLITMAACSMVQSDRCVISGAAYFVIKGCEQLIEASLYPEVSSWNSPRSGTVIFYTVEGEPVCSIEYYNKIQFHKQCGEMLDRAVRPRPATYMIRSSRDDTSSLLGDYLHWYIIFQDRHKNYIRSYEYDRQRSLIKLGRSWFEPLRLTSNFYGLDTTAVRKATDC